MRAHHLSLLHLFGLFLLLKPNAASSRTEAHYKHTNDYHYNITPQANGESATKKYFLHISH
jgi:hypothetical protein